MKDEDLLQSFIAGNIDSYQELVSRYSDKVYRLATQFLRNNLDAEEVLQDVFIAIYRKATSFNGESALSSWIYRITVNFSLMKIRKRNKILFGNNVIEQNSFQDETTIEDFLIQKDLVLGYKRIFSELSEDSKNIIYLREVDGLSTNQVSQKLGISESAVKSKLHRARCKIKQLLALS